MQGVSCIKMTIEQLDTIDFISTDNNGDINLSISDHLEWDDKNEHIYMLQEKINKYLSFIESGEIKEHVEDIKNKPIVISVVYKHKPNNIALDFLNKAKQTIEQAGFYLKWRQLNEAQGNS